MMCLGCHLQSCSASINNTSQCCGDTCTACSCKPQLLNMHSSESLQHMVITRLHARLQLADMHSLKPSTHNSQCMHGLQCQSLSCMLLFTYSGARSGTEERQVLCWCTSLDWMTACITSHCMHAHHQYQASIAASTLTACMTWDSDLG